MRGQTYPAIKIALPAILPFLISSRMIPAALRACNWPTIPCEVVRGSRASSRPRPLMWEWAPMRSILVSSWASFVAAVIEDGVKAICAIFLKQNTFILKDGILLDCCRAVVLQAEIPVSSLCRSDDLHSCSKSNSPVS